ncbi:MAG: methyltransferase domain-containing protein [Acidobacteriota bacterium]|nr:methyltransferase domain-containing protein [Acidobacteriota bacterium]
MRYCLVLFLLMCGPDSVLASAYNYDQLESYLAKNVPSLGPKAQTSRKKRRNRKPDVIYYPTPPETVVAMLRLATIKKGDLLYDLGSGDGRIPIAAAKQFGIRAVGIEIDPKLIIEAESNALEAGVADLVRFRNEDMFRIDVSEANIVTLYLSDKLNVLCARNCCENCGRARGSFLTTSAWATGSQTRQCACRGVSSIVRFIFGQCPSDGILDSPNA